MEAAATDKIAPLINLPLLGALMPEAPVMPGTDPTTHWGPAGRLGVPRKAGGSRSRRGPLGASPLGFGEPDSAGGSEEEKGAIGLERGQ